MQLIFFADHCMFKPFAISFGCLPISSSICFDGSVPYSFMELETLQIHIGCLNKPVIPGIACQFKSAPIILTLSIYVASNTLGGREGTWHNILLNNVGCTERAILGRSSAEFERLPMSLKEEHSLFD